MLITSGEKLREIAEHYTGTGLAVSLRAPDGATLSLGGSAIVVYGFNLTLVSIGGAAIDAESRSIVFEVGNAAKLVLDSIELRNGLIQQAGGIFAQGDVVH